MPLSTDEQRIVKIMKAIPGTPAGFRQDHFTQSQLSFSGLEHCSLTGCFVHYAQPKGLMLKKTFKSTKTADSLSKA